MTGRREKIARTSDVDDTALRSPELLGAEQLKKVREILFGAETRELEERLEVLQARLEQGLSASDAALRGAVADVDRQFARLRDELRDETRARAELTAQLERLREEQSGRERAHAAELEAVRASSASALEALRVELGDLLSGLAKRLSGARGPGRG